ncbi:MAG: hypothetical protein E2O50_06250 [Gammaproteobacteria bacterium]|nr:MAG: hypothetical protein E2O50_06250 [Gammaproteobacteria bacterium]
MNPLDLHAARAFTPYDFAGESLMHIDHFLIYMDRLSSSPLLALALAGATVSTVDYMQVSGSNPVENIVRKL